ncbi:hypothetical protein JG687_00016550 [Phytophthora cactorum]|uniref:Uncharacterized protein n=1 Tax=Phytophthora cactorum TaxID=29920 RepID=A0A8T1TTI2_9STRA|nr:hypothetical protein Pcac1_g898 [Phytophthora cactorum]KAG2829995.1 hypothetical protein PC111_g7532 [Phytophthora cactorum]KAG2837059.1 hypothetical protein PC112_g5046 [Phytophthora cactorum]KAG2859445.1 hypothetical protein PC113_g8925 [Phytophthora cactorum]KAG2911794.1 hypothetical protein PC117_g19054 [Phytophthora cactorum]
MPSEDSDAHATDHAETAGSSGGKAKQKKAVRFLPSSDILLLKEMVKHTPWAAGHGETLAAWDQVASGVKGVLSTCTADGTYRRRFAA